MALQIGGDVGEQHVGQPRVCGGQGGAVVFDHAEHGIERAAVVHVHFILAGPVKGLAGQLIEAFKAKAVPSVQVDIFAWKIFAHGAHQMGRGKEAGCHSRMTGGSAQQPGVLRVRGFDGIEGGGADY